MAKNFTGDHFFYFVYHSFFRFDYFPLMPSFRINAFFEYFNNGLNTDFSSLNDIKRFGSLSLIIYDLSSLKSLLDNGRIYIEDSIECKFIKILTLYQKALLISAFQVFHVLQHFDQITFVKADYHCFF